jgi:hypothetical protein
MPMTRFEPELRVIGITTRKGGKSSQPRSHAVPKEKHMKQQTSWRKILVSLSFWIAGWAFAAPSAITYLDDLNNQRIYVFDRQSTGLITGTLVVNYTEGSGWQRADMGLPPSNFFNISSPNAITYLDENNVQRISVFGVGTHSSSQLEYRLVSLDWDGNDWTWSDHWAPGIPDMSHVYAPSAITYLDENNIQRIYVFVTGANGHLFVNYWDGVAWQWVDQGVPSGGSISAPSAITYLDDTSRQRTYVFAGAGNGRLFVNYTEGSDWQWADMTLRFGPTSVSHPSAITYLDENNNQRIYLFVTSGNPSHLFMLYWNGSGWNWVDQGIPPGSTSVFDPSATTYLDASSRQRTYVFATGSNNRLVVNYSEGFDWQWADMGRPPGTTGIVAPNAITYLDTSGNQQIHAFGRGLPDLSHLFSLYFDGFDWYWADRS